MAGFGETLQQARAHKNMTLREAEAQTRIPRHHLAALEDENYAALPAPIYSRGIVRKYADSLGLDPGKMLDMYREAGSADGKDDYTQDGRVAPHRQELPRTFAPNFAIIAFGVVITAIVFAWGYSIWSTPPSGLDNVPTATTAITAATQQAETAKPTPPAAPTQVAEPTQVPATEVPVVTGGDNQTGEVAEAPVYRTGLAVTVSSNAEVTIVVDGQTVFQGEVAAGSSTEMYSGSNFVITSSDDASTFLINSCGDTSAQPMSDFGGTPWEWSASEASCPAPE